MVLNSKSQMFSCWFDQNYFYPEIEKKYLPLIQKMKLPYMSVSDFMNAQIQSVTFPGINLDSAVLQRGQYSITHPAGKELDAIINKEITIEFKLTESYLTYWILYDQINYYLEYNKNLSCWWDPLNITFLTDYGFEFQTIQFQKIVPTSLSSLNLSYKSQIASYNNIQLGLSFNYLKIIEK